MKKLLISNILLAFAGVASAADSQCLAITSTQQCKPFAEGYINAGLHSTVAKFDSSILSNYDANATYIEYFKSAYKCPGYKGQGQRYHLGMLCGLYVDTAYDAGCNKKEDGSEFSPVMLCSSVAETSLTTLKAIFSNPAICTPDDKNSNRTDLLANYETYVSRAKSNPSATCVAGLEREVATCGFFTADEAKAHCNTKPEDTCCASLGNASSPTIVPNQSASSASEGSSPAKKNLGLIIGLTIAGVVVLLLFVYMVVVFMKKRNMMKGIDGIAAGASNNEKAYYANENGLEDAMPIAETCEVVYNYVPNLSDEIYLYVGDKVIVKVKFDDGWALGYNMSTKQEGSFPLACVATYTGENNRLQSYATRDSAKISQRASSLYIPK